MTQDAKGPMVGLRACDIDAYRHEDGRNHVDFVALAPAAQHLPAAPRFILGGLPDAACHAMFAGQVTGPAGYYVVRDACLTHDGIMFRDDVMLTSGLLNFPEQHCRAILRAMAPESSRTPTLRGASNAVLLFGPGWTTWGHWLVDFLPRFFLLEHAGLNPFSMTWVIPTATPRFARELLHLLGVPDDRLLEFDPRRELLLIGELVIPVNLSAGALMHPLFNDAVAWMKDRMSSPLPAPSVGHERIFISRASNPRWRELINRAEIEDVAQSRGYTVIDPAVLSVADQISIFRHATRMAGEYGSGLHTSIFSPTQSIVTCLRGDVHHAGVLQGALTQACGQNIGYVIGRSNEDSVMQAYHVDKDIFDLGLKCAELAL